MIDMKLYKNLILTHQNNFSEIIKYASINFLRNTFMINFMPQIVFFKITRGNIKRIKLVLSKITYPLFFNIISDKTDQTTLDSIIYLKNNKKIVTLISQNVPLDFGTLLVNSGVYKVIVPFKNISNFKKSSLKEDFIKKTEQIKNLVQANVKNEIILEVDIILKKSALTELEEICKLFDDAGVERISIKCESWLNDYERKAISRKCKLLSKKYYPKIKFSFLPAYFKNSKIDQNSLVVDEGGYIYKSKNEIFNNLWIGNVLSTPLKGIIRNKK